MTDLTSGLVIISGPSGAGKDSIVNMLLKRDERLSLSCSATTRPPRQGEKEGRDYYFLGNDEFDELLGQDAFIEHASYNGRRYGTLKRDVADKIDSGKKVILVIDVRGAEQVRRKYPGVLSIFISPPSVEILEKRLRARGTDSSEAVRSRLEIARDEMKASENYDFVVVNDVLEDAADATYDHIVRELGL